MRKRTAVIAAAAAGGVGLVLLAPPVLAATTPGGGPNGTTATCTGDGPGPRGTADGTQGTRGYGYGMGMGRGTPDADGNANRGGMGGRMAGDVAENLPASGTLTAAQQDELAAMAEEEKLARDVYTALGDSTGDVRFDRIATSEQRHLDAVRVVLARYSIDDPTAGKGVGEFTSPTSTRAYASYLEDGKVSLSAALEVGRTIEKADIADLDAASQGLTAPDVSTLYARLSTASSHHLAAFSR